MLAGRSSQAGYLLTVTFPIRRRSGNSLLNMINLFRRSLSHHPRIVNRRQ